MWPVNLYIAEAAGGASSTEFAVAGWLEVYQALAPAERAVGQFVVTLLVASVVIGTIQTYGTRAVAKTRRSPIISTCVGFPAVLVLAGLAGTGYLILGTSLGAFFGMLFIVLGLTVLPAGAVVGYVGIGRAVATRLGREQLWVGVVTGSLLSGLVSLSLAGTVVLTAIAATVGTGALVRVVLGMGGVTSPDERTVPPANKI